MSDRELAKTMVRIMGYAVALMGVDTQTAVEALKMATKVAVPNADEVKAFIWPLVKEVRDELRAEGEGLAVSLREQKEGQGFAAPDWD